MPEYRYFAVKYLQTEESTPVLLFSAPCHEITGWAGIPRKEEKKGTQTVGFQRAPSSSRLGKLSHFLNSDINIIANPILCAVRDSTRITFEALEQGNNREQAGWLYINEPDYELYTLLDLLRELEDLLLRRLPELETKIDPSDEEVAKLLREARSVQDESFETDLEDSFQEESTPDEDIEDSTEETVSFSSESHIEDFFRELRLRRKALETAGSEDRKQFAGFSKDTLIEYLHAATVVDGQHRLLGSQAQLEEVLRTDEAIYWQNQLLHEGKPAKEVQGLANEKFSRRLGIALISNDDWAEHVFQFVVVNQKAVRIPEALLGSIIATTLTDEEVGRITERLGRADIQVMDYRIVVYLESSSESPFKGLIKRGYDSQLDASKRLDWSVVENLVNIFRNLRGGRLFHQKNLDYAAIWRRKALHKSKIIGDCSSGTAYDVWREADGPWREVFCRVWTVVRDHFAVLGDDPELHNLWGYPKQSNIFNGTSLSILAADFFAYLSSGPGIPINSVEEATQLAEQWLGGAKKTYFDRDWELEGKGIKKSEIVIKRLWSENWHTYRVNDYVRLPSISSFRP